MNIVIFIRTLLDGGAEKQSLLLYKALRSEYRTYLVVLHGEKIGEKNANYARREGIEPVLLYGNIFHKTLTLGRFLRKNRVKVIFSYLTSNNLIGALVGKVSGVRHLVGGVRNAVIPWHKQVVLKLLHNYLNRYTVFNNYAGERNLIQKGFKKEKCVVIQNCFESNIPPLQRKPKDKINIITVARFVRQKDYFTAIKSIHHLLTHKMRNGKKPIHYYIVGYGKLEREIRAEVSQYRLDQTVSLVINPDTLDDYYKKADIYFCTSLFEGLSNSILEAMSYSLPIVATRVGDNDALVKDGVNGFFTELRDYKKMAEKIYTLAISHDKRQLFGQRSYQKLKQDFGMDSFRRKYVELIGKLN